MAEKTAKKPASLPFSTPAPIDWQGSTIKPPLMPRHFLRAGIPIQDLSYYQMPTWIQLQLGDWESCIRYRQFAKAKLTLFNLLLGPSGHGKTSLACTLGEYLNEMNGFDWDVARYVILARDAQITSGYITSNYEEGEFIIVDEFHLVAPKTGSSEVQIYDINAFLNTIRQAGIGLIGLTQYLVDLDPSIPNKMDFLWWADFSNPFAERIEGTIEMRTVEGSGERRIDWTVLQTFIVDWCNTDDLNYVESLKGEETRTEESELKGYTKTKKSRLGGLVEAKARIIHGYYLEGKISLELAVKGFLTVGKGNSATQHRLKIPKNKYGIITDIKDQVDYEKRTGVKDQQLVKLLTAVDEELNGNNRTKGKP